MTPTVRELAILADAWLLIESARGYGLVTGGPEVDVARCEEAIDRARAVGVTWTDAEVKTAVEGIIAEVNGAPAR